MRRHGKKISKQEREGLKAIQKQKLTKAATEQAKPKKAIGTLLGTEYFDEEGKKNLEDHLVHLVQIQWEGFKNVVQHAIELGLIDQIKLDEIKQNLQGYVEELKAKQPE
jgi:hypothetical protein